MDKKQNPENKILLTLMVDNLTSVHVITYMIEVDNPHFVHMITWEGQRKAPEAS